jgi:hypothetical protein
LGLRGNSARVAIARGSAIPRESQRQPSLGSRGSGSPVFGGGAREVARPDLPIISREKGVVVYLWVNRLSRESEEEHRLFGPWIKEVLVVRSCRGRHGSAAKWYQSRVVEFSLFR